MQAMEFTRLVHSLQEARAALLSAADSCDAEKRSLSPGPGRWSVVGVLEHIELTQGRIIGLLDRLLDRANKRGQVETREMAQVPINANYRSAVPVYNAIPTSADAEPTGREEAEIRSRLAGMEPDLARLLETGRAHDCSSLIAPHSVGRLNFYEWLYLISEHDRLHTEQIETIIADL